MNKERKSKVAVPPSDLKKLPMNSVVTKSITGKKCCSRCRCKRRPPCICFLRCKDAKLVVINESTRSKVFIVTFAFISALFCAALGLAHLAKYLNILDYNEANSDG